MSSIDSYVIDTMLDTPETRSDVTPDYTEDSFSLLLSFSFFASALMLPQGMQNVVFV